MFGNMYAYYLVSVQSNKKNKILNLRAYTIFFNLSIIIAQTESQIVLDFFVRSIEGDSLNCIRYWLVRTFYTIKLNELFKNDVNELEFYWFSTLYF